MTAPPPIALLALVVAIVAVVRLATVDPGISADEARSCANDMNTSLGITLPAVNVSEAVAELPDGDLPVWRATIGDPALVVLVDIAMDDGTVVAASEQVGTLTSEQRERLFDHRC